MTENQDYMNNLLSKIEKKYYSLFSIAEIEKDSLLQAIGGLFLFINLYALNAWELKNSITIQSYIHNTYTCWPHFLSCGSWYFLDTYPVNQTQQIFYAILFAILCFGGYSLIQKKWHALHLSLLLIFVFRFILVFLGTLDHSAKEYFDIFFLTIFLLLPHKRYFLTLSIPFLYFISPVLNKFNDGWIIGTYFSELKNGIPYTYNTWYPFITNIVIFHQTIGSWFLMSTNTIRRRLALFSSLVFHLFSILFIGFGFPITMMGLLVLLFANYRKVDTPLDSRSAIGWTLFLCLAMLQFVPILIRGDHIISKEGNIYGMFLFESNDQCRSIKNTYFNDGTSKQYITNHPFARERCDVYFEWFKLQEICRRSADAIKKISWSFDVSVNGGPFYRLVDEDNACTLTYKSFAHNRWIHTPDSKDAQVLGIPVQNYYDR